MTMPENIQLQLQSLSDKIKGGTINKSHARYMDEIIKIINAKDTRIAELEAENMRLRDRIKCLEPILEDAAEAIRDLGGCQDECCPPPCLNAHFNCIKAIESIKNTIK
jgi:hypothetical protein